MSLGVSLVDLVSSETSLLEKLFPSTEEASQKVGHNMQFNFKILNKIDDLILTTYKQLVEQDRKAQKQEEKKQEEGEQKKEQSHMLHLIFLAFKTKFNAKFNLETNEGFQNNFLSLIGDPSI